MKNRIPLPPVAARADDLTEVGRDWVGARLAALGQDPALAGRLVPALRCAYSRTTLSMPDGGRATVDEDLMWIGASGARLDCPDLLIIETKAGSTPSRLDRILWSRGHRPARVSKYGTAMAALDPGLPSNRWARILRRSDFCEAPSRGTRLAHRAPLARPAPGRRPKD